ARPRGRPRAVQLGGRDGTVARSGAGPPLCGRAHRVGRPGERPRNDRRPRRSGGSCRRRGDVGRLAEVSERRRTAQEDLDHGPPAQPARSPGLDERRARIVAPEDPALPDGLRITIQPKCSSVVTKTFPQSRVRSAKRGTRELVVSAPDERQHSEAAKFLVPAGKRPGVTWRWSLNAYDGGHYRERHATCSRIRSHV